MNLDFPGDIAVLQPYIDLDNPEVKRATEIS